MRLGQRISKRTPLSPHPAFTSGKDILENKKVLESVDKLIERIKSVKKTEPLTLSVCIICKNERDNILRAVESMADYATEVVVMDTGSTDGTMDVLESNGFNSSNPNKRMYQCDWRDDFSYARNQAQAKCKGDYIIWLDADDEIPKESGELIKACMDKPGPLFQAKKAVLSINMINIVNGHPVGEKVSQPRIYPNGVYIGWTGKIHESIVPDMMEGDFKDVVATNIEVHHWGYDSPELNHQKNTRNMEYLKRERENPLVLYHMGTTSICMGELDEAVGYYEKLLLKYDLDDGFKNHARYMLGTCLFDLKRHEEAFKLFQDNSKPDATLWLAECYLVQEDYVNARETYLEYLTYGDIVDPWGTRQSYYRHLAYEQLLKLYTREIKTIDELYTKEYPERAIANQ